MTQKLDFFTAQDIADFDHDGYIVVRGLFGGAEMDRISAWADDIAAWPEVRGRQMVYFEKSLIDARARIINRIENFYPYHDGFRALFDDDRIRGRIAELFREPAVLFKEKINFKLSGGDGFKPHQDQAAGWWDYGSIFISALISIDEATIENGCLEIAAGNGGHRYLDREWRPFTDDETTKMNFVAVPTKPGDVIFFDSFVPHGSKPNLTAEPRRILYVTYNKLNEGDHRVAYFAAKRKNYPPDSEREPGKEYVFRV